MKVTKEWLTSKRACKKGIEWVRAHGGFRTNEIYLLEELIDEGEYLIWGTWYITKRLNKMRCVRYAAFAAMQVIGIYENGYPNDKRPREALQAVKKCLKSPNKRTTYEAYAAAESAYAAYYAAAANAGYTAPDAAAAHTAAAANAAYALSCALSYVCAPYYHEDYADVNVKQMQIKILKYGIKLIKETQKEEGDRP